ncbi:MAG: hypothetical protein EPO51_04770 [Phenylobacterium sp.]|uniref:hypothetical protein n=1 Tax=Phenylobacterium sp. TaxID=1871053 RepID=UPI001200B8C8|nr:hypothetical protein [Phenylobacterium sp.]TAJ73608.1 MAG: hypothetical protein EPO51_04770 [Phenylobacterium sp.]
MLAFAAPAAHPAVVARTDVASHAESYLLLKSAGDVVWVADPKVATAFASMRDAIRAASRLPANQRAYGLPREAEPVVRRPH